MKPFRDRMAISTTAPRPVVELEWGRMTTRSSTAPVMSADMRTQWYGATGSIRPYDARSLLPTKENGASWPLVRVYSQRVLTPEGLPYNPGDKNLVTGALGGLAVIEMIESPLNVRNRQGDIYSGPVVAAEFTPVDSSIEGGFDCAYALLLDSRGGNIYSGSAIPDPTWFERASY